MDYLRFKRDKYYIFYAACVTCYMVLGLKEFASFKENYQKKTPKFGNGIQAFSTP